ncbi:L-fuculokinase [Raoultella sp. HC6]|uniref:L-fuculokinase n=1 Tax=Raoultella sp. HC6 TaxID=2923366 RepID=UPI001F506FD0|nr:L-fuculokinase [Raoultella sp. HC6]
MQKEMVIVLDCGATNIRAMAIDDRGNVLASVHRQNFTLNPPENPQWHIWPLANIMESLEHCCRTLVGKLPQYPVRALTITAFGVDGALVDSRGAPLYPVISWKCPRTEAVMNNIHKYLAPAELKAITGVAPYSFNTLYKLIWLRENVPDVFERAHAWLFMSSLIGFQLTGEMTTERTMAGTSQLLDVAKETFSERLLEAIGITRSLFPRMVNSGEPIGELQPAAAARFGLEAGIPVIAGGHDTQFALYGSGVGLNQPVLSSGTWEILMVRSASINTDLLQSHRAATCELDSIGGYFNPGCQYLASGVLEWIRELYWPGAPAPQVYQQMLQEAGRVPAGCEGVTMRSDLMGDKQAGWQGVTLSTRRGHLYRSALEALSLRLREQLTMLEAVAGFKARELVLVGGGSRNALWNQIKADTLQLPVKVLEKAETTVAGAAMFAWAGCGVYRSADEARAQVSFDYQTWLPGQPSGG